MRRPFLASALLALCAVTAQGGADVETGRVVKAKSTLAPSSPTDSYRFTVPAGSTLSFALSSSKKGALQFAPALTDPLGNPVTLGPAVVTTTPKGVAVKNFALGLSGVWRLDVTATGVGDYSLAMTAVPQSKFGATTDVIASTTHPFAFSALPGSSLTLSAKAANGSASTPRFGLLTGAGYSTDLSSLGKTTTTSHAVSVTGVGGTGDLSVDVGNSGSGGDVAIAVVVKSPKAKPTNLDIRGARLGHPSGGQTIFGRVVGPAGGVVEVTAATSDLSGASVSVPVGALGGPVAITVSSAAIPPIPDKTRQAAGPAVNFGPSGLKFSTAATVTLPFDFSKLPVNATPSDIRVIVREKDGTTSLPITPLSIDLVHNTVTLPVSGFSVCVPIVKIGTPRVGVSPGGDEYWQLSLTYSMNQDFTANDSRSRRYALEIGEISFFPDNTFQLSNEERSVQVDEPDDVNGGVDGVVNSASVNQNSAGTWAYDADGQSIDATGGGSASPVLRLSRDGAVMIGHGRSDTSTKAESILLVRKNTTKLTTGSLSGVWHIGAVDVDASPSGPGQQVQLRPDHASGTFAFDGNGGCRVSVSQLRSQFDTGTGTWGVKSDNLSISNATYQVEAAGTVLVNIPPQKVGDTGDVMRLFPGQDAATMIGSDKDFQGGDIFAIVLVKQGSGLGVKSLVGPYRTTTLEVDTDSFTAGAQTPVVVADLEIHDEDLSTTFDGTASATFQDTRHRVRRDTSTAGGVDVANDTKPFALILGVSPTGAFTGHSPGQPGGVVGGVSADGSFGFFVTAPDDKQGSHLLGLFVASPPAR